MTEDKRCPIDRIELPPGINRDELLADIERLRGLLHSQGDELPDDIECDLLRDPRDELRADVESMRSLLRTRRELQSHARRQTVARALNLAKSLSTLIMGDELPREARLGIQYLRHRQKVLSLIEDLEKDASPAVVTLVGIDRGLSAFENAIEMIADLYRHYFDKAPGGSRRRTARQSPKFFNHFHRRPRRGKKRLLWKRLFLIRHPPIKDPTPRTLKMPRPPHRASTQTALKLGAIGFAKKQTGVAALTDIRTEKMSPPEANRLLNSFIKRRMAPRF
jgi:hypothetical protein